MITQQKRGITEFITDQAGDGPAYFILLTREKKNMTNKLVLSGAFLKNNTCNCRYECIYVTVSPPPIKNMWRPPTVKDEISNNLAKTTLSIKYHVLSRSPKIRPQSSHPAKPITAIIANPSKRCEHTNRWNPSQFFLHRRFRVASMFVLNLVVLVYVYILLFTQELLICSSDKRSDHLQNQSPMAHSKWRWSHSEPAFCHTGKSQRRKAFPPCWTLRWSWCACNSIVARVCWSQAWLPRAQIWSGHKKLTKVVPMQITNPT